MSKNVRTWMRFVLSLGFMVLVAGSDVTPGPKVIAQDVLTADWTASLDRENPDRINLNFERSTVKGGKNKSGQTYDFADLQGLSREQALSGGPVKFSLVREAGRIDCEGSFQNGKGSGTFSFTGNPAFVSAMKARGFDFENTKSWGDDRRESEDRLFAATTLNVTTALADDLVSSGFGQLNVDDLFKA